MGIGSQFMDKGRLMALLKDSLPKKKVLLRAKINKQDANRILSFKRTPI